MAKGEEKVDYSWSNPRYVEREIVTSKETKTIRFYSVPLHLAFKLQGLANPLVRSLQVLFTQADPDGSKAGTAQGGKSSKKTIRTAEGADVEEEVHEVNPVSVELVKHQAEERERALSDLIKALSNEANALDVARVFMACMRDEFSGEQTADAVRAFMRSLDLPTWAAILAGVVAANVGSFGPFGARLVTALDQATSPSESAPAQSSASE